jgi:hypothetical protein
MVGCLVGCVVGGFVGRFVGAIVGGMVGCWVGGAVGGIVGSVPKGLKLGIGDGTFVCVPAGCSIGDLEGRLVGDCVASSAIGIGVGLGVSGGTVVTTMAGSVAVKIVGVPSSSGVSKTEAVKGDAVAVTGVGRVKGAAVAVSVVGTGKGAAVAVTEMGPLVLGDSAGDTGASGATSKIGGSLVGATTAGLKVGTRSFRDSVEGARAGLGVGIDIMGIVVGPDKENCSVSTG